MPVRRRALQQSRKRRRQTRRSHKWHLKTNLLPNLSLSPNRRPSPLLRLSRPSKRRPSPSPSPRLSRRRRRAVEQRHPLAQPKNQ